MPLDGASSPRSTRARARMMRPPRKSTSSRCASKCATASLIGSETCKTYGTSSKPTGLLQDFADADKLAIRFGLMTGSYGMRKSGGVLRKNVARFTDEINPRERHVHERRRHHQVDEPDAHLALRIRRHRDMAAAPATIARSTRTAGPTDVAPTGATRWARCTWRRCATSAGKTSPNFSSNDNDLDRRPDGKLPGRTRFSAIAIRRRARRRLRTAPSRTSLQSPPACSASITISTAGAGSIGGRTSMPRPTPSAPAKESMATRWYVGSLTGGSAPNDVCTHLTVNNLSAVTGICPEAGGSQGSFKIAGLASFAHKATTGLQIAGRLRYSARRHVHGRARPADSLDQGRASRARRSRSCPVGYQTRNFNAMSLVNFRVISQAADGSEGLFFMNYENAPAGSDYDNDMKGFLRYIVTGNTIKVIMHESCIVGRRQPEDGLHHRWRCRCGHSLPGGEQPHQRNRQHWRWRHVYDAADRRHRRRCATMQGSLRIRPRSPTSCAITTMRASAATTATCAASRRTRSARPLRAH